MTGDVRYQWAAGDAYERYIGRWSRVVADELVAWLALPAGARCTDLGCGPGALSAALLESGAGGVFGLDRSPGYLTAARARVPGLAGRVVVADAQDPPWRDGRFDAALSALVLNFVPRPERMLAEMARVARPGGVVAAYVWDYAAGMEPIRRFWDAARMLDPAAAALDEAVRFPICTRPAMAGLFERAGLGAVEARAIDVPARFRDFDEYWEPYLSGEGPAPGYCAALPEDRRLALRETLRRALPVAPDGTLAMTARAWAARGIRVR